MDRDAQRVPTVDDLRVKLCWICREEEGSDNGPSTGPPRTWVHPCSCTLIAHQECLLEWIKEAQKQPSRAEDALKCPQCSTRYTIHSYNPFLLRLLTRLDRTLTRTGTYVTMGLTAGLGVAFAGSLYGLCLWYGARAIRVFVGDRMYDVIIGHNPRDWTWPVYSNVPLVPFYLLVSRSGPFIENILLSPFSILLFSITFPSPTSLAISHEPIELPKFVFSYPPSPIISIFLYPVLRLSYRTIRQKIMRYVLKTSFEATENERQNNWLIAGNNEEDNGAGIMGADLRIDVDLDAPDRMPQIGPQFGGQQDAQAQEVQNNDDVNPDPPRNPGRRLVRVTLSSFGRFIAGALILPWAASYSGKALEVVSCRWAFLRHILGLNRPPKATQGWLQGLILESPQLRKLTGSTLSYPPWQLQPMDRVWWRNSIGLSLFIVIKDALKLLHLYLRKRELQSRRILSRSFAGVDLATLDLITPR